MTLVQRVFYAITELQLGYQLEEREIKVTAKSHFDKRVVALELYEVLLFAGEVDHVVHTGNQVWPVVVPAFCRELQVEGKGDVGALQVLRLFCRKTVGRESALVAERETLAAEVHRRREAKVQVFRQAEVTQYAYAETRIPSVGIAHDSARLFRPVLEGDGLRADIRQLQILQVHADQDPQVQGAEVDVGLVLYPAPLCP